MGTNINHYNCCSILWNEFPEFVEVCVESVSSRSGPGGVAFGACAEHNIVQADRPGGGVVEGAQSDLGGGGGAGQPHPRVAPHGGGECRRPHSLVRLLYSANSQSG